MGNKNSIFGMIIGMGSIFFFSTYTVFGKLLLDNLTPETLIALTSTLSAGLILFFYGFLPEIRELHKLPKKTFFLLIIISLLSAVIAPLLYLKGLQETLATNAIIVSKIEPVIVAIISIFWLQEKFSQYQTIGSILMFIGVFYVATQGFSLGFSLENKGDLFIIAAALAGASSTAIFKKYLHHIKPEIVVLMRNGVGGICMLIILPIVLDFSHSTEHILDQKIIILLFSFALFTIIAAQILWYKALDMINASTLSTFSMMGPVFGITMAIFLLHEGILSYHIIGFLTVVIGLCITLHHEKKNPHPHHKKHLKIKHFFHH
jgi:drug/metabolite transporter (DMT)-like permease